MSGQITTEGIDEHVVALLSPDSAQVDARDDGPAARGFPIDVLPEGCARVVSHMKERLNYPTDYFGSAMLAAASAAIGTTVRLVVKTGWVEYAPIWMVLVGKPGANKTHPLHFAFHPHRALDQGHHETYRAEIARFKQEQSDEAGSTSVRRPVEKQHLVSDVTPEALVDALYRNPRGIGLVRDELAGWIGDFNRYSSGGEVEMYLSFWSVQPCRVDRKTDGSKLVPRPFVTVIGTLQPAVLNRLTADGRSGNGFLDRFLFSYPDEADMQPWSTEEMEPSVAVWYDRFIRRLVSIPAPEEDQDPASLRLSDEARKLWEVHYERLRKTINELNANDQEARAGHLTKMVSYTLRLALILQMMDWAESDRQELPELVEVDSLGAAIALVDYYGSTARKVLFSLHESTPVDRLPKNKQALYRSLKNPILTSVALEAGKKMNISARTVMNFLNDRKLFSKAAHG